MHDVGGFARNYSVEKIDRRYFFSHFFPYLEINFEHKVWMKFNWHLTNIFVSINLYMIIM